MKIHPGIASLIFRDGCRRFTAGPRLKLHLGDFVKIFAVCWTMLNLTGHTPGLQQRSVEHASGISPWCSSWNSSECGPSCHTPGWDAGQPHLLYCHLISSKLILNCRACRQSSRKRSKALRKGYARKRGQGPVNGAGQCPKPTETSRIHSYT